MEPVVFILVLLAGIAILVGLIALSGRLGKSAETKVEEILDEVRAARAGAEETARKVEDLKDRLGGDK